MRRKPVVRVCDRPDLLPLTPTGECERLERALADTTSTIRTIHAMATEPYNSDIRKLCADALRATGMEVAT